MPLKTRASPPLRVSLDWERLPHGETEGWPATGSVLVCPTARTWPHCSLCAASFYLNEMHIPYEPRQVRKASTSEVVRTRYQVGSTVSEYFFFFFP